MLVSYNLAEFRNAVGMTQKQLGEQLGGWSEASVSAAERGWDGRRVREFDADEIVGIARALGVPAIAMLLPPPDSGTGIDYVFEAGPSQLSWDDLLQEVVTDYLGDTKSMEAFRDRLRQLGGSRFMEAAQIKAMQILELARDQAIQLTGESRDRAESLERAAQERYQQAMGSLIQSREELERRVDDLRKFEREYRIRQIAYLEGLLNDLRAGVPDSGVFPHIPPASDDGDQP